MHACSFKVATWKVKFSHPRGNSWRPLRSGFEGKFSSGLKHGEIKIAKVSQKGRST
jgi:hypothetical protein